MASTLARTTHKDARTTIRSAHTFTATDTAITAAMDGTETRISSSRPIAVVSCKAISRVTSGMEETTGGVVATIAGPGPRTTRRIMSDVAEDDSAASLDF